MDGFQSTSLASSDITHDRKHRLCLKLTQLVRPSFKRDPGTRYGSSILALIELLRTQLWHSHAASMLSCLCGTSDGSRVLDAAKTGDVQATIDLIKKKPKLAHAQQWGGQTAWHLAAKEGHADVLQAMADTIRELSTMDLQQLSSQGRTAEKIITHLAQEGDTKCLTPLHLACIKGHAEAAGLLMKLGVNPFLMDSVGRTALHYAASWGHADCINAVLSAHAGPPKPQWRVSWPNDEDTRLVDVQNTSGFTPLHYAVWVGRTEAIQALASYDASLEVVNNANDYDWIKVGAGNTPLHLAAFGGDFDVVKLLLAAHVQTLAAGAEVMAAGQGQWGQRYSNDVRHVRNRRGLMAYHIAVHKHFQHLTELLHPDIPYTFIFSNDDMDVGSVRMYGPARLMVIAAKALQQKLISELEAVEQAAAASPRAAAAAKDADGAAAAVDPVLIAAGTDSSVASVPGSSVKASDMQQQQQQDARDAAAAAAATAAVGTLAAATAEVGSPTGELPLLSPFAAKSHKHWTSTSTGVDHMSIASATPASSIGAGGPAAAAAAAAVPTAAGQATSLISDTDQSLASATAAAVDAASLDATGGAADAATAPASVMVGAPMGALAEVGEKQAVSAFEIHAANACGINGDAADFEPVPAEYSFAADAGAEGGIDPSATAPATLLASVNSNKGSEGRQPECVFAGFGTAAAATAAVAPTGAVQQQYSGAASDAGASAISSSTIPGSTSAVAGTPAGSMIFTSDYASVASSTRGGYASSSKAAAPGSPVNNMFNNNTADRSYGNRGVGNGIQQVSSIGAAAASAPMVNSSRDGARPHLAAAGTAPTTAGGTGLHNSVPPETGTAASDSEAPKNIRHRRVQSTVDQQTYGRQGSVSQSRRATAEGLDNRRSGWLPSMGSFSRMHTRRDLDDILPPSAIVTTAADDDSSSITKQQQQQHQRRSSIGQPTRFSAAGAAPRSSSMRTSQDKVNTRPASITEQQEEPMQQDGNVAARQHSGTTGALQEQGSTAQPPSPGACVEDNPLDIMLANRASRIGESPEVMRQQLVLMKLASGMLNFQTAVSAFNAAQADALDALRGSSMTGRRLNVAMSSAATPSTVFESEMPAAASGDTGAVTAAAAAAADLAAAQDRVAIPAEDATGRSTAAGAAQLMKMNSLPALRNNSCRSMIAKQPSLKRLMSGKTSRSSLVTALRVSGDNGVAAAAAEAAAEMAAGATAAAGDADVASLQSTPAATATGELPIIQQCTPGASRMITEEDECESDVDECEICFDAHAVVLLQECGHTLCVGCCKEMCKLHHFKPALCPYCRQIICGFALQKSG